MVEATYRTASRALPALTALTALAALLLAAPAGAAAKNALEGVVYDRAAYEAAISGGATTDEARATAAIAGATVVRERVAGEEWAPDGDPQTTGTDGRYAWSGSGRRVPLSFPRSARSPSGSGPSTTGRAVVATRPTANALPRGTGRRARKHARLHPVGRRRAVRSGGARRRRRACRRWIAGLGDARRHRVRER